MKKKLLIIIIIVILLLGVVFIRPVSFYFTIFCNGYNITKIDNYKTIEKTRYGKNRIIIVRDKNETFNMILLSNMESFFWHFKKEGNTSTTTKPYSWLKWDKWFVEDGNLSSQAYITIIYKTKSNINIDTRNLPSFLEYSISQYKEFSVVDIYTQTAYEKELDQLDFNNLIKTNWKAFQSKRF